MRFGHNPPLLGGRGGKRPSRRIASTGRFFCRGQSSLLNISSGAHASVLKSNLHLLTSSALLLCTLIVRMTNLADPPSLMVDELYYVPAAESLLEAHGDPNYVHPPLGKLLIAVGMAVFGYNPFGWRIASAVAGSIMVPVAYLLGRKIFGNAVALVSSVLLVLDPLMHVMSRIAMLDIFLALFVALAFLGVCYNRLYLSAAALGLACGVKLVGAFALFGVAAYLICTGRTGKVARLLPVALLTFLLSLLPVVVSRDSSSFLDSFLFSVNWHLTLESPHPSAAPPLGWLVNIVPFPIYSASGLNIAASTNPLVYPVALPVAALLGYDALMKRSCQPRILPVFWLVFVYGFFFVLPRKTQFIFYLLPAVPAITLLVSYGIVQAFSHLSK